mmetsp:Transcript_23757/g.59956  ORF Transcript_23757/g.59956 Transcript_23757/m.59956 type:complete len:95 (+) Transcript_23757:1377-1661(+)
MSLCGGGGVRMSANVHCAPLSLSAHLCPVHVVHVCITPPTTYPHSCSRVALVLASHLYYFECSLFTHITCMHSITPSRIYTCIHRRTNEGQMTT